MVDSMHFLVGLCRTGHFSVFLLYTRNNRWNLITTKQCDEGERI